MNEEWVEDEELAREIEKLKPPAPDISSLPTPLLKVIVIKQEIERRMNLVGRHAHAVMEKGELGDWIGELNGVKEQLDASVEAVLEIDDATNADAAAGTPPRRAGRR